MKAIKGETEEETLARIKRAYKNYQSVSWQEVEEYEILVNRINQLEDILERSIESEKLKEIKRMTLEEVWNDMDTFVTTPKPKG
jgi:hypothetical protein